MADRKETLREMGYDSCAHPRWEVIPYLGGCTNPFNCRCLGHRKPGEAMYRCIYCAADYDDNTRQFKGGSVDARIKWDLVH